MNAVKVEGRMCGVGGHIDRSVDANRAGGDTPITPGTGFTIRPFRPGHRRSMDLALRMGHCAPAVMAALIADDDPGREGAVLAASAMAGGIGNCGYECGALTSSILYLGDRYGSRPGSDGVPISIALSRQLIERFARVHGGTRCDQIRKGGKNPLPCMRAMVSAPEILREVIDGGVPNDDTALGCHTSDLLAACEVRQFHCVQSVFSRLNGIVPECERLCNMVYPLVGGIGLTGLTCSAAAAGVMAIGLATGKIEDSRARVFAMMVRMIAGGDMMADAVNNFNPAINRGQRLMEWFAGTYGSVSCAELTGVNVRESETAGRYFSNGGIERCERIAASVADKAREIIEGR